MNIKKNISDYGATFYYIENHKIALAEISIIDKNIVNDTLKNYHQEDKKHLMSLIEQKECFWFNRLNVPVNMRNQGIGKLLIQAVQSYMNEIDGLLLNCSNAYGDLNQEQLISYYQKNGFHLIDEEGAFIYHQSIQPIKFHKRQKSI